MHKSASLREKIAQLIVQLPSDKVSVQMLLDTLGRDAFVFFSIVLALPFLVPISIPGTSTLFGAVIAFVGVAVMLNRTPWVPQRYLHRDFSASRLRSALEKGSHWLYRLEKLSRRRWPALATGVVVDRWNGVMLTLAALLLMAPFPLVPFSDTLPGLAVIFLCIGLLQQDGLSILLGYVMCLVTMIYFSLIIGLGALAIYTGWQHWTAWVAS